MTTHVIPKIGTMLITDLDQHIIVGALQPIWHEKAGTASKALNRINLTLKHAAALGLEVDLQAPMKARALLGKERHQTTHIPAMPYQDAPKFYQWLAQQPHMSCLALRFTVLTALRTSEIRFATLSDIDGDILTIPKERTKTGKQDHRVPLTQEAKSVIGASQRIKTNALLFTSPTGKPLSDAAMSRLMQRSGYEARPHGLRATFRTWMEEQTDTPYEVKETALGHTVGSEVERAYQRSDLFEKRRQIMEVWSRYLVSNSN